MDNTISPTLRLLNSSTSISVSGIFRLYIAFLLAGIEPYIIICLGFGLITYATYTLDRALDCEEDLINRKELAGANNHIAIIACIIAFLVSIIIFAKENLYYAPFIPFVIGYLYSKGIKIGKFKLKLKGGKGVKNVVVGLTWGGTIVLIVGNWVNSIPAEFFIFLFFSTKSFIKSIICDFKDIEGDTMAGVETLPVCFGIDKVKKILLIICILLHSFMILSLFMEYLNTEATILVYSFFIEIACIHFHSSSFDTQKSRINKYLREILNDGESTMVLTLRAIIS
ncbi:MAG: UbiA family prenyltransferase [Methanosarcinales archaeon]|nr:UbiA family prenyltransferase [Methanosarcinales archaeon]